MNKEVVRTLLYFDIFKFPLKIEEINKFTPTSLSPADISLTLEDLQDKGFVKKKDEYFYFSNKEKDIESRIKSEALASKWVDRAYQRAGFIAKFPFVKAVMISGSLSKGVMFEDGDIDFFIVTQKNRLWVARAFLVLYKRIFLLNSKKNFCINYFKTEEDLNIEDQNKFTAIELTTVIPIIGKEIFENLKKSNEWAYEYVRAFREPKIEIKERKAGLFSKLVEWIFKGSIGDKLDEMILNYTVKRNAKKYEAMLDQEAYEQMFRSNAQTAKVHPDGHQQRVLQLLDERENEFYLKNLQLKNYA